MLGIMAKEVGEYNCCARCATIKMAMSEAERKQVTVTLRRGAWEVQITCAEDKLKQAIESVLSSIPNDPEPARPRAGDEGRGVTCRALIESMWRDDWFTVLRSLADVDEELGRRGYHYDRTAVSHSLTDLVRENILAREGAARNYRYIQKKPAG
jgi:hypothetical protein